MYYVVVDSKDKYGALLVKTKSESLLTTRVRLEETESMVACFTNEEVEAMRTSDFAVVSAGLR